MNQTDQLLSIILEKIDRLERHFISREVFQGELLLDNNDLQKLFGVTKRTLAEHRKKSLINYYVFGGKIFYKASEVQGFLKPRAGMQKRKSDERRKD